MLKGKLKPLPLSPQNGPQARESVILKIAKMSAGPRTSAQTMIMKLVITIASVPRGHG